MPPAPGGLAKQTGSLELTLPGPPEGLLFARHCSGHLPGTLSLTPPHSRVICVQQTHLPPSFVAERSPSSGAWHTGSAMHAFAPYWLPILQLGKLGP